MSSGSMGTKKLEMGPGQGAIGELYENSSVISIHWALGIWFFIS